MLGNRSVDDGETETRRVGQLVRLKVYGPPAKEDSSIVAHRIIFTACLLKCKRSPVGDQDRWTLLVGFEIEQARKLVNLVSSLHYIKQTNRKTADKWQNMTQRQKRRRTHASQPSHWLSVKWPCNRLPSQSRPKVSRDRKLSLKFTSTLTRSIGDGSLNNLVGSSTQR